jgi:hypothetical protein
MNARSWAQEATAWYVAHSDPYTSHQDNVYQVLRRPMVALTLSILHQSVGSDPNCQVLADGKKGAASGITVRATVPPSSDESSSKHSATVTTSPDWRAYLAQETDTGVLEFNQANEEAYDALSRRTKARLEAFLTGTSLAVATTVPTAATEDEIVGSSHASNLALSRPPMFPPKPNMATGKPIRGYSNRTTSQESDRSLGLIDGLAGFHRFEHSNSSSSAPSRSSPVLSSLNAGSQTLLRSISASTTSSASNIQKISKQPQIAPDELTIRMELYIRALLRVSAQQQECVLGAEPARALKARARSIVIALVDTVGTVRQQSPVLTRLLSWHVKELLAVDVLGESVVRLIRKVVSDYEHKTSFASLAFLSSPDDTAEHSLTPMVLWLFQYLQTSWRDCVSDCELERMLKLSLPENLRSVFKTIEFRSIGHLLETCQEYRDVLQHIELAPGIRSYDDSDDTDHSSTQANFRSACSSIAVHNNKAIRQAIRDLQREVITVNGNVLPPVTSRIELVHLLSQTLNSRSLQTAQPRLTRSQRRKQRAVRRVESAPILSTSESEADTAGPVLDSDGFLSSGNEGDLSDHKRQTSRAVGAGPSSKPTRRRRNFHLSTVDFLTKRLLLAAGRTGTGGDAYFVVRDLFGGDDIEVVPSHLPPSHARMVRPGSIEIIIMLSSVTIKCHGSFDVYPTSLVGDCEPLIQLHTTTTEVIQLQEVRASDSSGDDIKADNFSSEDESDAPGGRQGSVMVIQERQTERTGWRTLSIRPALYEKVESYSTPSWQILILQTLALSCLPRIKNVNHHGM